MFTKGEDAERWVKLLSQSMLHECISNVETEIKCAQIGNHAVPITINETEYENSYVCSPFTAYISYARDELGVLKKPLLEKLLYVGIFIAEGFFKWAKINQTVSLNNWLFSTNIHPAWSIEDVEKTKETLLKEHSSHSLTIRSINLAHHPSLIEGLKARGWLLIPARQVYLFSKDKASYWWKRNNVKQDRALLRKVESGKLPFTWVKPEDLKLSDFEGIHRCFYQLYVEKHSEFNPQLTKAYLYQLHQQKYLEFHGLKDTNGRIVGVIGLLTQHETITTPIVGYDTELPKKLGLYRILIAILFRLTYEREQEMNLSSGAGYFKQVRGGEPTLEYTAFYVEHLPWYRKLIHKGICHDYE